MMSGKNTVAAAPSAAMAIARKAPSQKKSCDLCVLRKRKCDGVIPTCGFCLSRGSKCHYSLRRPNRPRGYAKRLDARGEAEQPSVKNEGKLASVHGDDENESRETQHGQPDPPSTGWKRIRLSASPATGLVGTKENVFLGHFFSCLGFLPLTDERLIRGAMMEMLLASSPGSETVHQGFAERLTVPESEALTAAQNAGGPQGGGDAASACALWCTIAMGGLVQGQPLQQVAPYMHLAWTSLSQCFDTITVESGRAFLMMAYLYNFMGDDHNFCKYLQSARRVINRLPDNTVQKQEIGDLVMMGNDTRIFHTAALEPSELNAYCTDESPALEVPDVVHKSDLCRLLLQADRRMMKAFLRDHRAQATVPFEYDREYSCHGAQANHIDTKRRSGDGIECHWLDEISREGMFVDQDEAGYLSGMSIKMNGISIDSTKIGPRASPSRPAGETWKCMEEARRVFARLGKVADAPEIRAGVGSLLYNSILGYLELVTGSTEPEAGFEKVKHCAEILSRYPGLCRFTTWRHLSHCLLSFLAKLGDVKLFEELREAYNSVCEEDAPEVPPHAEWTMVGFCDHIFCRSMDHLDQTWGGLNDTRLSTARDLEEQRRLSEQLHWLHDTPGNNNHWTSLAPGFHPAAISGQPFPPHGWTESILPHFMDPTSTSAQQSQYMASAPSFSSVGPEPMPPVSPIWSNVGEMPVAPPGDRIHDGASACPMSSRVGGYAHSGRHFPAFAGATNASLGHRGAGDMWAFHSGEAAARSAQATALTATLAYDEETVHSGALDGEEEFSGTTDSSSSEGGHGAAKPSADHFHWWVDADSANHTGKTRDG